MKNGERDVLNRCHLQVRGFKCAQCTKSTSEIWMKTEED